MANMLTAIGAKEDRLVPIATVREKFSGSHAVWAGKRTAGTLRIYPTVASPKDLVTQVTDASFQECSGRFASTHVYSEVAAQVTVICQREKLLNYQFVILPRAAGGHYLHTIFAMGETTEAVTSSIRYGDMILASAKK